MINATGGTLGQVWTDGATDRGRGSCRPIALRRRNTLTIQKLPRHRMPNTAKRNRGLKLLGNATATPPASPSASTLETFVNAYRRRDYRIRFESSDFTSLCPITGQPDFARITINYVPDKRCIETKSLKFYLSSFRNTRSFNEEIVNRILEDLVAACNPRELTVHGEFAARGSISVTVEASHPSPANRTGDRQ